MTQIEENQKIYLDTLSRLFTNHDRWNNNEKDTCVAVCYHEDALFIASNKKNPEYAQKYIGKLREFANNQSSENYENLLKESVKQICQVKLEGSSVSSSRNSSTTSLSTLPTEEQSTKPVSQRFREKASECKGSQQPDWSGLQIIAEELFQDVKEAEENSNRKNQGWKLLTPWHDTIIIEAIKKNKLDENILEIIRTPEGEKINYVESESEEENNENKKTHAEMKIINRLYTKKLEGETPEVRYIGSTKKTCASCWAVIDIFGDGRYNWDVYGIHGSDEYKDKWKTPKIVSKHQKEAEVEEKAKQVADIFKGSQLNHTTSEVPERLFNPVELLEELRFQEQTAQSESPPKQ